MAFFLSPVGNDQQCDANGNPLVGGTISTFLAGSSTPAATYTDSSGVTPQANPMTLNSLGLTTSPIWMAGGIPLKFIIKDSGGSTIRTVDNVSGVNDTTSSVSEWTTSGLTPTFISATSFSVPGDQTLILQVNRRLKTTNTGGTAYSTITAASFAAGITTVTVTNDSIALDSGLTALNYGFLSYTNNSYIAQFASKSVTQSAGNNSTAIATTAYSDRNGSSKIQPITATVATNAMTITLNPTILDFRDTTLGSGAVTTVSNPAAITLVIPAGASLGAQNAVSTDFEVLAINNAGTMELAVRNKSSFVSSEQDIINTTILNGASTSALVTYSTTARTGVAYRVVGIVRNTQATAGTYATAPSFVQGIGGKALAQPITYGTTVATTSGTSIDFTGLQSVNRINVLFNLVSTNGTSFPQVQIGAGSVSTSGYSGYYALITGASVVGGPATTGFVIASNSAANNLSGVVRLTHMGGNVWTGDVNVGSNGAGTANVGGGVITLGGALDRVRLTTVNGTDTFDAGAVNITFE